MVGKTVTSEWGYNTSSTFQRQTGECWIYALYFSVSCSVFVSSIQCYDCHMGLLERIIRPIWLVKCNFLRSKQLFLSFIYNLQFLVVSLHWKIGKGHPVYPLVMLDNTERENGSDLQILYEVLLSNDNKFALIFRLSYCGITENLGFAKLKGKFRYFLQICLFHCKKLYLTWFHYILLHPSLLGLDESSAGVLQFKKIQSRNIK